MVDMAVIVLKVVTVEYVVDRVAIVRTVVLTELGAFGAVTVLFKLVKELDGVVGLTEVKLMRAV